jgi:hypothetical protein
MAELRDRHAATWPYGAATASPFHPDEQARRRTQDEYLAATFPGCTRKALTDRQRAEVAAVPASTANTAEAWGARARMADARRAAGAHLDDVDIEALRRYPTPPRIPITNTAPGGTP